MPSPTAAVSTGPDDALEVLTGTVSGEPRPEDLRVPQPHGGALRAGGKPGNRGGRSYPSAVRRMARKLGAERLGVLAAIGDGVITVPLRQTCPDCGHVPDDRTLEAATREALDRAPKPRDQVQAIRALLAVGLGSSITIDDVRGRLQQQVGIIRERLPHEAAEGLLDALAHVWR